MPHQNTPADAGGKSASLEPIFISVKQAAEMLGIAAWSVYELCDSGAIASQYHGKRRLVRLESVRAYADSLPTERPEAS